MRNKTRGRIPQKASSSPPPAEPPGHMSDNNSAVSSLLVVGFASAMLLWYGNRKRRTIWHPMSTWWNKRQALLANSRLDQLLVITDFDATITMGDSIQCHDMLGFSELMSPTFREAFAPLLDWASNPSTDGVGWCVCPQPPAPGSSARGTQTPAPVTQHG